MVIVNTKSDISGEDIQITLNVLKNHINEYEVKRRMISKEDVTRSQRIEELVTEEKRLSQQFRQIRKQIRRYERRYEKILKKKVKLMSMQIKDDMYRLNTLKEKYQELNEQLNKNYHKTDEKKKKHTKKPCKVRRIKRGLRMFKQKIVPFSRKIKIKIKQNKKLGRREMLFVNDSNTQQSFTKVVNVPKSNCLNTRECKVVLKKLSEERINKIIGQGENQQKNKQTSVNSSEKNNESEATDKPNWHIKIPKSVFEEIQKEDRGTVLNDISPTRNITTQQMQSNGN
ncbi:rho GTPase-activating protein gacN-like [Osmia bicornis bicornis]|uniref:rho GTPase-activating protein gacN-like n=1 Tax=Osmia bicornis bicornis TaxID=1437191 RepID=UPI001EAF8706|nr:rho GTPase-activating protein gacN-like [Osmia bicornis bicornis]